jgi:RND superfamily putative drug exporter
MFLVQLAFIVAFGVLLDTVLVRSLLVPALT